jgi:nucleotide-binding universal stress UspA family protein
VATDATSGAAIVVGYDGSEHSARALGRAASLVGRRGKVVVVTAAPSVASSPTTPEPILDSPSPRDQHELLESSRVLLEQQGVRGEYIAARNEPAEALADVARRVRADLIVVGRTGTGFVTRALLGSTSENVIRKAPCDVLVVI